MIKYAAKKWHNHPLAINSLQLKEKWMKTPRKTLNPKDKLVF
jgi:hypothetical protein